MRQTLLTHAETAYVCRSLGSLLHAGISAADACFLLAQEETGALASLLTVLGRRLDEGAALWEAMAESGSFPPSVSGMVQVGEQTGRVEEALFSLADFHEDRDRISRQVKNALGYPCMLLMLMLLVVGVLLVKVLPVFDSVYASLGSRLTGIAAGLLQLGQWLEAALPFLFFLLLLGTAAGLLCAMYAPLRRFISRWLKKSFDDRGISRKFSNARFARAFAMGVGSGLSIEDAVQLSKLLLQDSPGAVKRCGQCAAQLADGVSLTEALGSADLLPAYACRMLSVGLKGGNADRMLEDIASRMLEEASEELENAVERIEPAMVLTASALVGVILLAVMLPLMNILSSIG